MTSDGETSGATAGRRTDGKRVPGTAHELRCVQAQLGAATTGDCRIYRIRPDFAVASGLPPGKRVPVTAAVVPVSA